MFTFKVVSSNEVRRVAIENLSLDLLKQAISKIIGKLSFSVTYVDGDGDVITIGSSAELEEAYRLSGSSVLRLSTTDSQEIIPKEEEKYESPKTPTPIENPFSGSLSIGEPLNAICSAMAASADASALLLQEVRRLLEVIKLEHPQYVSPSQSAHENQDICHSNVTCDQCGIHPIRGFRYKCSVCHNFDLCSKCQSKNEHNQSHPLILLRQPCSLSVDLSDSTPADDVGRRHRRGRRCFARYQKSEGDSDTKVPQSSPNESAKTQEPAKQSEPAPAAPIASSPVPSKPDLNNHQGESASCSSFSFVADPYRAKCEELMGMGFDNPVKNLVGLRRFDGDLSRCIDWLLSGSFWVDK